MKRNERVSIPLTEKEKERYVEQAFIERMSLSKYTRLALEHYTDLMKNSEETE